MSSPICFSDARFNESNIIIPDTNFWLCQAGFNTDPKKQKECDTLVYNVTAQGALFALNVKSVEEIKHVVPMARFEINGCPDAISQKRLKSSDPIVYHSIYDNGLDEAEKYIKGILGNSSVYEEAVGTIDCELIRHAGILMRKYGLRTADSLILAIALKEGATHLATLDQDFNNVNETGLQIIVDSGTFRKI